LVVNDGPTVLCDQVVLEERPGCEKSIASTCRAQSATVDPPATIDEPSLMRFTCFWWLVLTRDAGLLYHNALVDGCYLLETHGTCFYQHV
jgi:hypothetical protein